MQVVKKHKTPLERQITESILIENSKADILLNKKSKWNGSKIPRIRVEVARRILKESKENEEKPDWTCENSMKRKRMKWKKTEQEKRKSNELDTEEHRVSYKRRKEIHEEHIVEVIKDKDNDLEKETWEGDDDILLVCR